MSYILQYNIQYAIRMIILVALQLNLLVCTVLIVDNVLSKLSCNMFRIQIPYSFNFYDNVTV